MQKCSEEDFLREKAAILSSTVQNLRLEICYFQGEAKKLEWEKNRLEHEVKQISTLFRKLVAESDSTKVPSIVENRARFALMARFPSRRISELVRTDCDECFFLTSCDSPHFIEVQSYAPSLHDS